MKVLVTGATGFLGNNLVRLLNQQGIDPVCWLRPGFDARTLQDVRCEQICGPFDDPQVLDRALAGVDVVVHSAALIHIGWTRQAESWAANVELTERIARAASQRGARFVHISSVDTLAAGAPGRLATEEDRMPPKPGCAYVVSKRAAEEALAGLGRALDVVIVHPGFMVGPFDWKPSSGQMMLALAKQFVPLAPGGGCCVVDVRDVAQGIFRILEQPPPARRYILGGENVSYLQLWREMAAVLGRRGPLGRLTFPIAQIAGGVGDLASKFARGEGQVNSAAVRMGQLHHYYSSQRAAEDLGYTIRPYREALHAAADWFRARGYL